MPNLNEVTTIMTTGEVDGGEVEKIVGLAADACSQLADAVRSFWVEEAVRR